VKLLLFGLEVSYRVVWYIVGLKGVMACPWKGVRARTARLPCDWSLRSKTVEYFVHYI
jgi:hypothetical protein